MGFGSLFLWPIFFVLTLCFQINKNMKIEQVEMTPDMARKLLSNNKLNRQVSQPNVNYLKSQIIKKQWILSPDAIVVDTNGDLANGQHRLMAILETNKTVPVFLMTGADPKSKWIMDTGKIRTAGDVLSFDKGRKYPSHKASTIKRIILLGILTPGFKSPKQISTQPIDNVGIQKFIEDHKKFEPWFDDEFPAWQTGSKLYGSALSLALQWKYIELDKFPPETIDAFFHDVSFGAQLNPNDPAFVIREMAIQQRSDPHNKFNQKVQMAYLVSGLKIALKGDKVSRQQLTGQVGQMLRSAKGGNPMPSIDTQFKAE